MEEGTRQAIIDNHLAGFKNRTLDAWKTGGKCVATAYMATIYGMWTNALRQPNHNPFSGDEHDPFLYRWFGNGYEDFSVAIKVSAEIRKKQLEADKARQPIKKSKHNVVNKIKPYVPEEPEEVDKSFWKLKLW